MKRFFEKAARTSVSVGSVIGVTVLGKAYEQQHLDRQVAEAKSAGKEVTIEMRVANGMPYRRVVVTAPERSSNRP